MLTIAHVATMVATASHPGLTQLKMIAGPPATVRTVSGVLSVVPTVTQALTLDPSTQTGAILMTVGAILMVPIEMEPVRVCATMHDIMNNVLNFGAMSRAGAINDLTPGVMTGSHLTLTRTIVPHAMLSGSRVILSGTIALHATLMVLIDPLIKLSGLIHKILAGRAVLRRSAVILFRANGISTSGHQKMNSLKGTTNVLMARSIKDARQVNLTGGAKLLTGPNPRQKNSMSLAYPMGVFSKDPARYSVKTLSSGRK